jgi:hypothetical protein
VIAGKLNDNRVDNTRAVSQEARQRMKEALVATRGLWPRLRAQLLFVTKSHPLGAILLSPLSDPLTRGDRLLIQVRWCEGAKGVRAGRGGACLS